MIHEAHEAVFSPELHELPELAVFQPRIGTDDADYVAVLHWFTAFPLPMLTPSSLILDRSEAHFSQ